MKLKQFKTYNDYWKSQVDQELKAREVVNAHPRLLCSISLFKQFIKQGEVLDVGCRDGWSTEQLNKKGFDAIGIELNPAMVKHAKEKGRNVFEKDMSHTGFPENKFEGIFCVHALEHVRDPHLALNEFYRISKSGAIIYFEVPKQTKENIKHSCFWEDLNEFRKYISDHPTNIKILKAEHSSFGGSGGADLIIIGRVVK